MQNVGLLSCIQVEDSWKDKQSGGWKPGYGWGKVGWTVYKSTGQPAVQALNWQFRQLTNQLTGQLTGDQPWMIQVRFSD